MSRLSNGIGLRARGLGVAAAFAASLLFAAAPGVSAAGDHGDHGRGGDRGAAHFGGGGHEQGGHFDRGGGPRFQGRGDPRFGGRFDRGDPRFQGHFDRGGPRFQGRFDRDGPRFGGRFGGGPRFAAPQHWVGMHPRWGWGGRTWVRPWGPTWVPHYWGGGYWRGAFWPHVYLGWDFPWFLATLPFGYSTYWWGGVPFYYWQGVYYVWSPDYDQYVVTDPPPLTGGVEDDATAPPPADDTGAAPAPGPGSGPGPGQGAMSLFVYPKNGQSDQQTADDRFQCHQWAVGQTGFDPTNSANDTQAATATPANYKRAMTACLEARGYSVR